MKNSRFSIEKNSDAKNIGNKMLRRFQIFIVCLGNMSPKKKTVEDSAETFVYFTCNGFGIH